MKLPFSRLWGMQRSARRARAQAESVGDAVWLLGGRSLSASQAIQVAAVFRCVDIISKTMAALPLFLYRDGPEGKEKAKSHPLYRLLYVQPNRHTTAYELIQMYVANLLLTRGAFCGSSGTPWAVLPPYGTSPPAGCRRFSSIP